MFSLENGKRDNYFYYFCLSIVCPSVTGFCCKTSREAGVKVKGHMDQVKGHMGQGRRRIPNTGRGAHNNVKLLLVASLLHSKLLLHTETRKFHFFLSVKYYSTCSILLTYAVFFYRFRRGVKYMFGTENVWRLFSCWTKVCMVQTRCKKKKRQFLSCFIHKKKGNDRLRCLYVTVLVFQF